jgi:Mce-associated membrane protein
MAAARAYHALSTSTAPFDPGGRVPRPSDRRVVITAAAVIAVATTALAGIAAGESSHQQGRLSRLTSQQQLREQVLAAGRQIAVDFASYDYRHIDADFRRVANEATGEFKKQFVTQSAGVRPYVIKAKSVSTAEVASAGLVDIAPASATVVIALDRTIKTTTAPNGQQAALGVEIDLVRQGGRWLASGVKPL